MSGAPTHTLRRWSQVSLHLRTLASGTFVLVLSGLAVLAISDPSPPGQPSTGRSHAVAAEPPATETPTAPSVDQPVVVSTPPDEWQPLTCGTSAFVMTAAAPNQSSALAVLLSVEKVTPGPVFITGPNLCRGQAATDSDSPLGSQTVIVAVGPFKTRAAACRIQAELPTVWSRTRGERHSLTWHIEDTSQPAAVQPDCAKPTNGEGPLSSTATTSER